SPRVGASCAEAVRPLASTLPPSSQMKRPFVLFVHRKAAVCAARRPGGLRHQTDPMPKLKPETQQARREHILDAAERCIANTGFHRTKCRTSAARPTSAQVQFTVISTARKR